MRIPILTLVAMLAAFDMVADGLIGGSTGGVSNVVVQTQVNVTNGWTVSGGPLNVNSSIIGNGSGGIYGFTNLLSATNVPSGTDPSHVLQADGSEFITDDNLYNATNLQSANTIYTNGVGFSGSTNTFVLNNTVQSWNTSMNVGITGYSGTGQFGSLCISNTGNATITVTWTAPGSAIGPITTNLASIPTHKTYLFWAGGTAGDLIYVNAPGQ